MVATRSLSLDAGDDEEADEESQLIGLTTRLIIRKKLNKPKITLLNFLLFILFGISHIDPYLVDFIPDSS